MFTAAAYVDDDTPPVDNKDDNYKLVNGQQAKVPETEDKKDADADAEANKNATEEAPKTNET